MLQISLFDVEVCKSLTVKKERGGILRAFDKSLLALGF